MKKKDITSYVNRKRKMKVKSIVAMRNMNFGKKEIKCGVKWNAKVHEETCDGLNLSRVQRKNYEKSEINSTCQIVIGQSKEKKWK